MMMVMGMLKFGRGVTNDIVVSKKFNKKYIRTIYILEFIDLYFCKLLYDFNVVLMANKNYTFCVCQN